jgi:plasmid replication initiation protein
MELFKKLMGVPAGKYDVFRDFKRRVLDKAIDEVNMYSDLIITSEFVKEGRRVAKVRFKLKDRAKRTRLGNKVPRLQEECTHTEELKAKLLNVFGLSEEQVEQLLTEYDSQFIRGKMDLVEASKPFQEGKVQNLAGYLLSAVKNNYQPSKPKQNALINMQDAKKALELNELKRQLEGIKADYAAYRERTIQETIQGLSKKDRKALMEAFFEFAEPVIHTILQLQRNKYSRDNILESPQMKALLRQFALRELDFISLASLEEFVAQIEEEKREVWQKLKSYDPDHALLRFSE